MIKLHQEGITLLESIFEFLLKLEENESLAPILDFIFKWSWVGPMYIVDHFVFPIVNVIGEIGFLILFGGIFCALLYIWLRPRKNSVDYYSPLNPYYIQDDV